jgi:hypothetical protein
MAGIGGKNCGLVQFGEMQVLQRHPRGARVLELSRRDEARALLLKAAKQVEPIMKTRGWKVRNLVEIIPPSPNLMGWNQNRGETIAIRLRQVRSDDSFFDFHHVLGTLLHELCHIVHGPHDTHFYALLDELWGEVEGLMDKGVSGLGPFESTGYRAGGILKSHADAREAQVQAALKRQRLGTLMGGPSSGKRLGGGSVGKDVRALAAEAAQRRAADNIWCQAPKPVGPPPLVQPGEIGVVAGGGSGPRPAQPTVKPAGRAGVPPPANESAVSGDGASGRKGKESEGKGKENAGEGTGGKRKSRQSSAASEGGLARHRDESAGARTGGGGGKQLIDLTWDDEEDVAAEEDAEDCVVVAVSRGDAGASQSRSSSSRARRPADKSGGPREGLRCPRCGHSNPLSLLISQCEDAPLCSSCGAILFRQ